VRDSLKKLAIASTLEQPRLRTLPDRSRIFENVAPFAETMSALIALLPSRPTLEIEFQFERSGMDKQ